MSINESNWLGTLNLKHLCNIFNSNCECSDIEFLKTFNFILTTIPEEEKNVVEFMYGNGYHKSIAECAEKLNITVKDVNSNLYLAQKFFSDGIRHEYLINGKSAMDVIVSERIENGTINADDIYFVSKYNKDIFDCAKNASVNTNTNKTNKESDWRKAFIKDVVARCSKDNKYLSFSEEKMRKEFKNITKHLSEVEESIINIIFVNGKSLESCSHSKYVNMSVYDTQIHMIHAIHILNRSVLINYLIDTDTRSDDIDEKKMWRDVKKDCRKDKVISRSIHVTPLDGSNLSAKDIKKACCEVYRKWIVENVEKEINDQSWYNSKVTYVATHLIDENDIKFNCYGHCYVKISVHVVPVYYEKYC